MNTNRERCTRPAPAFDANGVEIGTTGLRCGLLLPCAYHDAPAAELVLPDSEAEWRFACWFCGACGPWEGAETVDSIAIIDNDLADPPRAYCACRRCGTHGPLAVLGRDGQSLPELRDRAHELWQQKAVRLARMRRPMGESAAAYNDAEPSTWLSRLGWLLGLLLSGLLWWLLWVTVP